MFDPKVFTRRGDFIKFESVCFQVCFVAAGRNYLQRPNNDISDSAVSQEMVKFCIAQMSAVPMLLDSKRKSLRRSVDINSVCRQMKKSKNHATGLKY